MAMFGKKNNKEAVSTGNSVSHSTTIITACMDIKGNIFGCGTIHIDGIVRGDLMVDEHVIIGESGKVFGQIKSKKVMVSGRLEGTVACDTLEVTKTGFITNNIHARNVISDGRLDATVLADEVIHITDNGRVETTSLEGKQVIVNGHINGDVIASEILEINKDGQVKGTMRVKKIKVTEGGLMLGSMLTYDASDSKKPAVKIETKTEEPKQVIEATEVIDTSKEV